MFPHLHRGRSLTDAAAHNGPYSSPEQTNIVVSYRGIPMALVGDGALLLSLDLNVNAFLKYKLHALCDRTGDRIASVAWVSVLHEVEFQPLTVQFFRAFTLPPPYKLTAFLASPRPSGTNGVVVNGLSFPLAIIPVWEAWMRVKALQEKWRNSKHWLVTASCEEPQQKDVFIEALSLFHEISWGRGLRGFSDNELSSIASLTRFTSSDWLSSTNMNHLSDMLQSEINDLGDRATLVSTDWIQAIRNRKAIPPSSPTSYLLHPLRHRFLHRQGRLLVQQELHYLAGTTNLTDSHWISFIIRSPSRSILIGDSMFFGGPDGLGTGAHAEVIECIQWFLWQSNFIASLDTTAYTVNLLHVNQQSDGHSCGIFAQNSLDRYFNPDGHLQIVPASMCHPRAEEFIKIARRHLLSPPVSILTVVYLLDSQLL